MARRKREFNAFNLSFLDIMSCGFGAVVLVFLIMNHAIESDQQTLNQDLLSEVSLVEEDVTDGEAGLVRLRNTIAEVDQQILDAQGRADRAQEEKDRWESMIRELEQENPSSSADVEQLKADIQSLEKQVDKLKKEANEATGTAARATAGDGAWEYPTGLRLAGSHIAILLDVSTSMLAAEIVNIKLMQSQLAEYPVGTTTGNRILARSMKWNQALRTVDWLTSQLPIVGNYQVITFNGEAEIALPGTEGKWLEVANQAQLEELSDVLRQRTPSGGTSLVKAINRLSELRPTPDNIIIITDSLPTQGDGPQALRPVSPKERAQLFTKARSRLPPGVPVNIFLYPMEGDPWAPALYWNLANLSGGSFIVPSQDWP